VGVVPVLRRLSKRREVSSVVAVTPEGRLCARHVLGAVDSAVLIAALRQFRRQLAGPLLLVWDRLAVHRSQAVRAFLAAHPADYTVVPLPPYAPELNPEEQCNAVVKRELANALPRSIEELRTLARRGFQRLRRRPDTIRHFFQHAGLYVNPAA
jgi:transposase